MGNRGASPTTKNPTPPASSQTVYDQVALVEIIQNMGQEFGKADAFTPSGPQLNNMSGLDFIVLLSKNNIRLVYEA